MGSNGSTRRFLAERHTPPVEEGSTVASVPGGWKHGNADAGIAGAFPAEGASMVIETVRAGRISDEGMQR